jgi:hypothetical protein
MITHILFALALIAVLLPARAACAKGGGSSTVNAVGPKDKNLKNLENSFYAAVNPIISAYAGVPTSATVNATVDASPYTIAANGKTGTAANGVAQNAGATVPVTINTGYNGLGAGEDGIPQPYGNDTMMGQMFNDATKKAYVSNARYDDLLAQSPGLLDSAAAAGDEWYDLAKGAYASAEDLKSQSEESLKYTSDVDKWYSDYAKDQLTGAQSLMNTGNIPQPLLDSLQATVNQGLKKSMGASLNNLAARGVLNSSVTNKGLMDASQAAGDALNRGYLDAFNAALGGYQGNAAAAANAGSSFTDTFLNLNSARDNAMSNAIRLGESYAGTGSQRTGDLLNVHGANLAEREQLMSAIPAYFTNAASPMTPAYDFLQTMLQDHWNSNKQDTIVKQGK